MSAKKQEAVQGDKLKLYQALVGTNPKVELKGATHPYTSLNGNMFSYLHPSGSLALRLGEKEREQFLKKYKTTLFQAYGVVQKEYVTVPDSLLKKTKELAQYFELSFQYAQTLKPKPSKKQKSA
jgi:TfoX/Sxy family transcriptional regulator of competence genes